MKRCLVTLVVLAGMMAAARPLLAGPPFPWRRHPVEQSSLFARRRGTERLRPDRHRSRRKVRMVQGDKASANDWSVHDGRASHRQLFKRAWSRQSVAQTAGLDPKRWGALDHLWRRGSRGGSSIAIPQFRIRGLAGSARLRQEVDARGRSVPSRQGRLCNASDAGFHAGGCGRLLLFLQSGISVALRLRPQHCGHDGKLRLPWTLLDLGSPRGKGLNGFFAHHFLPR